MKKLDILKAAAELVVSVGVGTIVGNTIKTTTPNDLHMIKKVCVSVGSFVLSGMVSDAASKYISEQIDDTAENVQKALGRKTEEEPSEAPKSETIKFDVPDPDAATSFANAMQKFFNENGSMSLADVREFLGQKVVELDTWQIWTEFPEIELVGDDRGGYSVYVSKPDFMRP